jgi:hypothetical protein
MLALAVPAFQSGGSAAGSDPASQPASTSQRMRERKKFIPANVPFLRPPRKHKTLIRWGAFASCWGSADILAGLFVGPRLGNLGTGRQECRRSPSDS